MNIETINITKVVEKPSTFGITNFKAPKYCRLHHRTVGFCLYVQGVTANGDLIHFYTPQAIKVVTTGMLYTTRLSKNTGNFFKVIDGDLIGHKSPFEGDNIMPVVIEDRTKIMPSISVNDTITISFKESEFKFGKKLLKIVRLLNN